MMKWAGLKADVPLGRRTLRVEGTPWVADVSGRDHDAALSQCGGSTIQLGAGADFQNLDSRGQCFFQSAGPSPVEACGQSRPR